MTESKPAKGAGASAPVDRPDQRVADRILDTLSLDEPHTFTTQRGVVLQLHKVPKYLAFELGRNFKKIPPPLYDAGDGNMEPNPLDPDYLEAMTEQNADKSITMMKTFMSLGATVKFRPEDVEPPESQGWSDDLEELGVGSVPVSGRSRFHAWLVRYVLLDDEFDELWKKIARYSGLNLENDVAAAVEANKSAPKRGADPERAAPDSDTD